MSPEHFHDEDDPTGAAAVYAIVATLIGTAIAVGLIVFCVILP